MLRLPSARGPPLHPPLEPSNELTFGEHGGRALDDLAVAQVVVRQLAVVQDGFGFLRAELRPEERR
jgi:hypothetical protein